MAIYADVLAKRGHCGRQSVHFNWLAAEVFPDLAASARRPRGKQKAPTKQLVSLRLDREVIEAFKAEGRGWQSRMSEALKEAIQRR